MTLNGKWPGIIRDYDAGRREVRVEIPGLTDGAQELPIAEIEYPIGDKSRHTEIRILVGDEVWLEFVRGDPRFPVITGWRCPAVGSDVGTRRWHHENIETDADSTQKHTAGTTYTIEAGEMITLKVGGSTIVITSDMIKAMATQIFFNE